MTIATFFKRLLFTLLAVITGLILLFVYWVVVYWPSSTVRYRLEVTFDAGDERVTGSTVQQLTVTGAPFILGAGSQVNFRVKGQALPIELPDYGAVFVTMLTPCWEEAGRRRCAPNYGRYASWVCDVKSRRDFDSYRGYVRQFDSLEGTCPIPQERLPFIVRFEDEQLQKSARVVRLDENGFIPGTEIRFVESSLTFTDDAVTTGLEDLLTWLVDPDHTFNSSTYNDPEPDFPYVIYQRK